MTGLASNSVSVTVAPASAVPVNTGRARRVSALLVSSGAAGAVESPELPPPPLPPPAAPRIATPPAMPSSGLNENPDSGAGNAAAGAPDAYISRPPSASSATGCVAGVTVSAAVPPMFSIDSAHGLAGVQRVKKPSSDTLRSSGRSILRSASTRLTSADGATRPPNSLTTR